MFESSEDARADQALHEALSHLPVPEVSADFDARIEAALLHRPSLWQSFRTTVTSMLSPGLEIRAENLQPGKVPTSGWRTVWTPVRSALPTAALALTATLLLVRWAVQTPLRPATPSAQVATRTSPPNSGTESSFQGVLESSLESVDLTHASLSLLARPLHRSTDKRG